MSERIYELWRGDTVEDDYDNEAQAIEAAQRAADSNWNEPDVYEVVKRTGEDTYEVVWSSRD